MLTRTLALLWVLLLVGGCGTDKEDPVGPAASQPVVVIGSVTAIMDLTPVDGGITIDLAVDGASAESAYFPSLFTDPPPDEDLMRLYDLVRRVEVGDRVRIEGDRVDGGIAMTSLWILEGSW